MKGKEVVIGSQRVYLHGSGILSIPCFEGMSCENQISNSAQIRKLSSL